LTARRHRRTVGRGREELSYTVSDQRLVLTLTPAEEGGFVVTSPIDSELVTQAETIEEAFEMARDALAALRASRSKLLRSIQKARRTA
jgi:predicted RNase H-like HicB family nuclease